MATFRCIIARGQRKRGVGFYVQQLFAGVSNYRQGRNLANRFGGGGVKRVFTLQK